MRLNDPRTGELKETVTAGARERVVALVGQEGREIQRSAWPEMGANVGVVPHVIYRRGIKLPADHLSTSSGEPGGLDPVPVAGGALGAGTVTTPTVCLLPVCTATCSSVVPK